MVAAIAIAIAMPGEARARDAAPPSEPAAAPADRGHAIAIVRASIAAASRDFAYVDRVTPSLRPYSLFAAPLASIDVEIYPLARARTPVLEGLGVTAGYARAFALSSADASCAAVTTSWGALDLGARERIRLGRAAIAALYGGYSAIDYRFDGALGPNAALPSVAYRFARAGADLRVLLGATSIYAAGSYLAVTSTGLESLFPRTTVGGVEARLGGARALAAGLELSIEIGYTRFYYAFHPEPGDAHVAGGALDQMARVGFAIACLL